MMCCPGIAAQRSLGETALKRNDPSAGGKLGPSSWGYAGGRPGTFSILDLQVAGAIKFYFRVARFASGPYRLLGLTRSRLTAQNLPYKWRPGATAIGNRALICCYFITNLFRFLGATAV
jgi:hypothetical protein